ncbi:helix-turn-helix domain-containing protein [Actinomadura sp. LD22]|uniref:Helix-turn-helix domain-containing protein n=2 Tax=Actinomadura physcomitrii TaxID=2650748 RepID=A0A6I4MCQ2_9ACTN|nr:helix-turn-helix domain-containing protein [Actinomadura physcomitrii]
MRNLDSMDEPLGFWSTPTVSQALATCDVPALMDEIRKARGWSQTDLAEAVGYTQSWASKVLRGETSLTLAQVRIIIRRLGIPAELLRFGDHQTDEEDPTNRRQFGKLATLALLPSPRTSLATGENTAADLTAITGSQRRLDASFCSRDLIDGVRSHLELAVRAHRTAGPHAPAVAAAVSEAAGFAAWLSMDMLDLGSARTYYRQAITAAKLAKNDVLAVYMTGSLAAFEIDAAGDPLLGLAMIDKARRTLPPTAGSTPTAWLASLEALAHASTPHPDEHAATQAIRTAEHAIARTDGPPPWPWVYPFDLTKLARIRASIAVRLGQPSEAARAFGESLPTAQPAPKQAALTTLEVATAACQRGETDEAFTLALDALNTGITYGSERIIRQARQFRYSNAPTTTPTVTRFDDRLRTTLL